MKKLRVLTILAVLVMLVALLAVTVSAAPSYEWVETYNGWQLYCDGALVRNEVVQLDAKYYGFNDDGYMIEDEEFYCDGYWYRAKADGTLYTNAWVVGDVWNGNGYVDGWYYYGADARGVNDFQKIGGAWYFFNYDGSMVTHAAVWSDVYPGYWIIDGSGTKSTPVTGTGWKDPYGVWFYIKADGEPAYEEAVKIGNKWYAFDYKGAMATNTGVEIYDDNLGWCYVRAKADGTLYENAWFQDGSDWYYYGKDGIPANGWMQIGKTWYYFGWSGLMLQDTVVCDETGTWYALNADGSQYKALNKQGWNDAFGYWYYLDGDDLIEYGFLDLDGKVYYFDNYRMAANEYVWYDGMDCFAGADGSLLKNAWGQYQGRWVYAGADYQLYYDGIYQIGSEYYLFEECFLYTLGGEYENYYVTNGSGVLYRNKWYEDTTGNPNGVGWAYYGSDGRRIYNGTKKIGGSWYYFSNGIMQTQCVCETEDGVYWFGTNGVGTKWNNDWHQDADGNWYYVTGNALASGRTQIGGKYYYFLGSGIMSTNDWWGAYNESIDEYAYYLYGADGAQITKAGWHQLGYLWYVVKADGTLQTGWYGEYYLDPYMAANTAFEMDGVIYYANNEGKCSVVKNAGLLTDDWGDTVYIEQNGTLATNTWKKINGHWYYFGENGYKYRNDVYTIDGVDYLFDNDGVMVDYGWCYVYGDWYYSKNGTPVTGLQTINGKQYIFSSYGYMYTADPYYNDMITYNGVMYLLASDGHVLKQLQNGWNQINGDWYYVQDGSLVCDEVITIGSTMYGFDEDGRMLSGGLYYVNYDYYIFDASGKVLKGWQKVNGKWSYGTEYGYVPYGWEYIDGEQYVFIDGYMKTGTIVLWGWLYTTDSSGVVINEEEIPDGLHYENGEAVYIKNGYSYTGWIGNHFFQNGYMVYNDIVEYNGNGYYMNNVGLMVTGWYELPYGGYVYAYSNGTLACSEWVKQGNTYYYFYGYNMLSDTVEYIDGAYHEFDEDGKWLGELQFEVSSMPALSDGWQSVGGSWYYYHAGAPVYGEVMIGSTWYAFDGEGMITNGFYGRYYYGSNGTRAKYTGWKQIDGQWLYFNDDYQVKIGLVPSGSNYYYTFYGYDEDGNDIFINATEQWLVIGGRLYKFGSDGVGKQITSNGWQNVYGSWFYLKDGAVVTGYQVIDGVGYYFNEYEGFMYTNEVAYVDSLGACKLFGANGAMITKTGWYQTEFGWAYVDANGNAYGYGIYMINGGVYSFQGGYWVQ